MISWNQFGITLTKMNDSKTEGVIMNVKELFRGEDANASYYIESISDDSINFFISWSKASQKEKKLIIREVKKLDSDIKKSETKIIKTIDKYLLNNEDVCLGKTRKDLTVITEDIDVDTLSYEDVSE